MTPAICDHPYVVKHVLPQVRAHLNRTIHGNTRYYQDYVPRQFVELLSLIHDPLSIRSLSVSAYGKFDFLFDGTQANGWLYRPELYSCCTASHISATDSRELATYPVSLLNGYLGTLRPIAQSCLIPEADLSVGLENAARKPFHLPWYLVMTFREHRGGARHEKAVRRHPSPDDPKYLYVYSSEWLFQSGSRPPAVLRYLPRLPYQQYILLPTCRAAIAHLHSIPVEIQKSVFVMDHRRRPFNEWQGTPEFAMLPSHVRRICQFDCFEQIQTNVTRSMQKKTDPLRKWSKMTPYTAR